MSRVAASLCRFLAPPADRRPDGALLSAFLDDQDEAAFAELVRRHGPLVWGLCRRALPDPADAEDAFQAAFLVLVRRAHRLTAQATVGPWLYKVAAWTARNLRRRNARQLARRVPLAPDTADRRPGPEAADLAADLDAALLALPEKYRTPLILCHLQGWSRRDAAERLRVPEGTLSALLSRGLMKLRDRLAGHDPLRLLGAGSAAVPVLLAADTARAAGAAKLALAGTVSASVSQLVEGVLHMFWVQKATTASLGLVVVFGLGLGVGMGVRQVPRAAAADTAPANAAPVEVPVVAPDEEFDLLRQRLDVTEVFLQEAEAGAKITEEKLKVTAKRFADGEATASDVTDDAETLRRFKQQLAEAERQRAEMIARIKELEARRAGAARGAGRADPPPTNPADPKQPMTRKAPPQPTPPTPPTPPGAANPFRRAGPTDPKLVDPKVADELKEINARLQELEALQQRLNADRAKIQAEAERMRATAAEFAARAKEQAAREKDRAKERGPDARGTPKEKAAPAGGGHLEVVVGGRDAWWPCWVKEYGADGKSVGSVICDSVPMLGRFLARTMSDPKAPKDLRVTVQPGATDERTKAVLDACKAAGFRTTRTDARGSLGPVEREILLERGLRGAGQEWRLLDERLDLEKLRDAQRLIDERLDVERLSEETRRAADRAMRNELRQKEEAIRALEEAQKQLERFKQKPDKPQPDPKKPPRPLTPKPPGGADDSD